MNGSPMHASLQFPTEALQVLRVVLGDLQCAIDLHFVERVVYLAALRQLPGGPHYVAGLLDYHGESLVVVDLGLWLGLVNEAPYDLDTPIILCSDGQTRVGLLVRRVMEVVQVSPEAVQMRSPLQQADLPCTAALSLNAGLVLLLDMAKIIQLNFVAASSARPAMAHAHEAQAPTPP